MLILVYFELGKASEDLAQALRVSVSSKEGFIGPGSGLHRP